MSSLVLEKSLRITRFNMYSLLKESPAEQFDKYGTRWAHGLRGVAAVMVCTGHMLLVLDSELFGPADEDGHVRPLQLPFLRLGIQGSSWVAVFFIMLGFVNALKALELRHEGDTPAALSTISRSFAKQLLRLAIPAAAVTLLSAICTNVRAEEYARNSEARWLRVTSPPLSATALSIIKDVSNSISGTWSMDGKNEYDASQWVLKFFCLAYSLANMSLLLTLPLSPYPRMSILVTMAIISLKWSEKFGDPLVGFTSISGVAFAELIFNPRLYKALRRASFLLSPLLIVPGLYLMSYPPEHPNWAPWSARLHAFEPKLIHRANQDERFYASVGAIMFFAGCMISPSLKRVLSVRLLEWLGTISYSLYLLHGTLMRTVFSWCMFLGSTPVGREERNVNGTAYYSLQYPYPGKVWIALSLAIYVASVLIASHIWTRRIEPVFGSWSNEIQKFLARD